MKCSKKKRKKKKKTTVFGASEWAIGPKKKSGEAYSVSIPSLPANQLFLLFTLPIKIDKREEKERRWFYNAIKLIEPLQHSTLTNKRWGTRGSGLKMQQASQVPSKLLGSGLLRSSKTFVPPVTKVSRERVSQTLLSILISNVDSNALLPLLL